MVKYDISDFSTNISKANWCGTYDKYASVMDIFVYGERHAYTKRPGSCYRVQPRCGIYIYINVNSNSNDARAMVRLISNIKCVIIKDFSYSTPNYKLIPILRLD